MVNMDDFDKKTPTSMVQYGFCCVSVECCEVTVASNGPGDQSGLCWTGFPQFLLFLTVKKLKKNVQKYNSEMLLTQQC